MIIEEDNGDILFTPPHTEGPWYLRELTSEDEEESPTGLKIVANSYPPVEVTKGMRQEEIDARRLKPVCKVKRLRSPQ